MLAHVVYFTLKDSSQAAIDNLVADCREFLTEHPGTAFFAAGVLEPELDRPVNVRDFHVALHVVFETRADHDRYQTHERHLQFIEKNKENWSQVRVFDSIVS